MAKPLIVAIRPGQEQDNKFLAQGVDAEVVRRAREALRAFHRIRPQLAAFARVMTGDSTIGVLPTGGAPATDGKNIYIKPNLGLGDYRRHPDPRICHTDRHDDGLLKCEACRESEEIMVSLFHEIGHIVYDSFEAMDSHEKERAVQRAIDEAERAGISARRIERVRKSFEKQPPQNYIEAAARISPFMPMLLNALEDARVNDLTIKARPGMKIMFAASDARIFDRGVEQITGEITRWNEAPDNAQMLIGAFIVASGVEVRPGWLSDHVIEALADKELSDLLEEVREAPSVKDVYKVAFPILERMRALGYCRLDKEEEDDDTKEGDGPAEPDQQDTGGDDDEESSEPQPGPSQSDPFGESEDDEAEDAGDPSESGDDDEGNEGASDDEGAADTEPDDEGEEGDAGSAGMSAEEDGDEEGGEDTEPDDDPDNENGEGGSWDSQERDDLGEPDEDMELEDGDGDLGDDEVDDDEAEGSASTPGDDTDDTDDEEDEAPSGDEDGPSGDDEADGDDDPDDEASDDTGDPHASDTDDEEDDYEDDDDWGDDEHALEDDGEGGDPNQQQEGEPEETYNNQGTPEDVAELLGEFGGHSHEDEPPTPEEKEEEEAIDRAIEQDKHFDQPSDIVAGVREHDYDNPLINERGEEVSHGFGDPERGRVDIDERNIQSAVIPMRKAFAANKQGAMTRNLRSGRINGRSLAKRVPANDDRMFQKRRRPQKRDYHVVIGLDISGSTGMYRGRLERIKSAAYMQAELCSRVGVPFEVWAHTGVLLEDKPLPSGVPGQQAGMYPWQISLEMYKVKSLEEAWTDRTRDRLMALQSYEVNLDGHTLEFYRKRLDTSLATDKLLIYYTDGAMPNFNYEEELAILQRELDEFKRRNYAILGVGIDTDSPTQHGLDTVAVYNDADVRKVVMELEKRLA